MLSKALFRWMAIALVLVTRMAAGCKGPSTRSGSGFARQEPGPSGPSLSRTSEPDYGGRTTSDWDRSRDKSY